MRPIQTKNILKTIDATDIQETVSVLDIEKALLNILEDFSEEKNQERNTQRAVLNILEDYTADTVKKEVVEALNEDLLTANKELEAFTYSVSHDLRAPLRAVNGFAQIIHEDYGATLDEEGNRLIETIRRNAVNMGILIDELLNFSRIGRKELQKTTVDLNELTNNALAELNKSVTHQAAINIHQLPKVNADYVLIHQVMLNLISNAVKYSSNKEQPLVEIFSEVRKNEIVVTVKDNGAGFNMDYYDKLFSVFQRLHRQNEFEGVGVGLAIVQRIITKHGGKVWAEGKVNEGASFYFSLPYKTINN